ncbi:MAG: hypothetical protein IT246_08385 [Bacteroidia bacterium]|nr:hypothetical protein [Bacteroidia bacterium]
MDRASTIGYGESFEQTCDNCGAELQVRITRQTGHNEKEEYNCPECGKEFSHRASLPIRNVKVLRGRTDGRTDRFTN